MSGFLIDFRIISKPVKEDAFACADHPGNTDPAAASVKVDDQTLLRQGMAAFLKVFDDIKLRDNATLHHMQNIADILVIDEMNSKNGWQSIKRIGKGGTV